MTITFNCPGCGKSYHADASRAGRRGRCKACGEMMTVPNTTAEIGQDSEEVDSYALEDPPPVESIAPEPSSFVRSSSDGDGRTSRKKKRGKNRNAELIGQVKGEAEEVIKSHAGLIRNGLIAAVLLAIALGIVAAAVPNGTFIAGATLLGLGLLVIASGYALGVYIAYTEDLLHAALFLTFPIYTGYYIVTNWDVMWRPFALMLVGGVLLSVGATVLETTQTPEDEMESPPFAPPAARWTPGPTGPFPLAKLLG
jgi:hypothetical protein